MKKNDILKEKLKSYSVLAGAVITGGAVNAQIQYTDVDPDIVIDATNSPYMLDLNGDTMPDIVFAVSATAGTGSSTYMGVPFTYTYAINYAAANMAAGGLEGVVAGTGTNTYFLPNAHDFGAEISGAGSFDSSGALGVAGHVNIPAFTINYPVVQGNFVDTNALSLGDKYMGYRIDGTGTANYGWIRLSVSDSAAFITIKAHAINTVADQSIFAGNAAGIESGMLDDKVSIISTIENVRVNVSNELLGADLMIVDMTGKVIKDISIEDVNTVISLKEFNSGIYIVRFVYNDEVVNKRIYVR